VRRDLPTGTVTFLFTDIEGSTKLLHELGAEGYAEALAEHRRVLRDAAAMYGGVEVDTQGDAVFFAFPTAAGAIQAAGVMTEALSAGPIQVRIGSHTGAPLVTDAGYVGEDVHFVARVAASGHGGQVLVSSATAALVRPSDKVSQGPSLLDLGEHRLKDIDGPVAIFQLGEGRFPPLKTISNTNLPSPASSFVGREHELHEVVAKIEEGARLLTLTGPGGSGKTRLAIEAAASLVPEYKAGVFWVGLAALRDPALVTETVAEILGAKDGLQEHIGDRELLLLVDNLEQVIEAAPDLSALLLACPNLTLLVTSRELLRVHGEVEYPVPPLAEQEAVALFCERAQLEPSSEIAELCARLDSLPLAVELAAARTKALSPAQILERLSQRLDLLKGGRDADPRQQTLRATVEWSYDLLSKEEQQLFRRLSVFTGGCTLAAAEEVADAELDTLQSLVEKSLLRVSRERYWMLETIGEYARELLAVSEESKELSTRHAEFFAALGERGEVELQGREQEQWLKRLGKEIDNFRAALSYGGASDRPLALALASDLHRLWVARGLVGEGRRWLEQTLAPEGSGSLRQRALGALGTLANYQGDLERASELAEERLALARSLGDLTAEASSLNQLARVVGGTGDFAQAGALREQAIMLAREVDPENVRFYLNSLATIRIFQGDHGRAAALIEEALAMGKQAGDRIHRTAALSTLGFLLLQQGDVSRSLAVCREGLELSRRYSRAAMGLYVSLIVHGFRARGDLEQAARLLGAAEALAGEFGSTAIWKPWMEEVRDDLAGLLGAERFGGLLAEGRELSEEEVVNLALRDIN
jgi:predicted ATPase/class 3 adenylate cyclase